MTSRLVLLGVLAAALLVLNQRGKQCGCNGAGTGPLGIASRGK